VNYYPDNAQALIIRARVYLQMKDNAKALADIDAGLKVAPRMPLALYYKALVMEQANDVKQAWDLVQNLPPAFVNSRPEFSNAVSRIAINAGHAEIGTSMLAAAVANFPKNVDARVQLASRYLQLMDSTRALQVLEPMSDSSDPRIVLLLAQAFEMQQQYSKSVEYLEKASDAGIGGDALKRRIALTNLEGGNVDAAIAELEKLNAASPGEAQFAGPLVGALIRKNEDAKAQEITEKLAAAAPTQPYGPYYQGQLFLRKGDLDSAVSAFSRAIERDAKFVPALYARASVFRARGDLKPAAWTCSSAASMTLAPS
jgi:predicted Zn-dependent protease